MIKRIFVIAIVIFTLGAACKKVDVNVGTVFLDNSNTQIYLIDTFKAQLSTVYIDSFVTSGLGTGLTGAYVDPVFGRVESHTYMDIFPPSYADIYENTSYDSIQLILRLNKSYYGDTTKPITINVERLAQNIVPPNEGSTLYNVDDFSTSTLLGSKTIVISPNKMDSIAIRLSDVFGQQLMAKLQDRGDQDMQNESSFIQYFKGIKISTSTNNSLIFGYTDSCTMRLNYKKNDLYTTNMQADFGLGTKSHQFNNISVNRTGTLLQNLNSVNYEIYSDKTNNMALLQSITGSMVKIRFPSLKNIYQIPNFAKIVKANLIVRPVRGSYNAYAIPSQLRLSQTTQSNQLGVDIGNLNSSGVRISQLGNLVIDDIYGDNTYYSYDITEYLKGILTSVYFDNNGLLLVPPSPAIANQVNRILIGDANNSNSLSRIQLQVYYVTVQ
jgi:Domain of unknown function (DUF4270)